MISLENTLQPANHSLEMPPNPTPKPHLPPVPSLPESLLLITSPSWWKIPPCCHKPERREPQRSLQNCLAPRQLAGRGRVVADRRANRGEGEKGEMIVLHLVFFFFKAMRIYLSQTPFPHPVVHLHILGFSAFVI